MPKASKIERGASCFNKVGSVASCLPVRLGQMPTVWAILTIVMLSCAVKLGYIAAFDGGLTKFPAEGTDSQFYDAAARVILKSGVYGLNPGRSTTVMPPGQSFFLATLYSISHGSIAFAKLAHVGVLTLVSVLVYFTGKTIVSASVGFWAAILTAVDPAQAYLSGTFLSEPLFIFFVILAIYFLVLKEPVEITTWHAIGAGFCFAIAGLTRNQGWLFSIFLMVGAIITKGRLISIRKAAIILIVTAVVIAPWSYRNYLVSGHFITVSSEGGLTLWACNNPEFNYRPPAPMSKPIYAAPPNLDEWELDHYYRQKAIEWIKQHPGTFLINGFKKLSVLFHWDPKSLRPEVSKVYRMIGLFPYGLMVPFIFFGLIANLNNQRFRIIYLYILFTIILTVLFCGDSRLRAPIQPYLYLFGVVGLHQLVLSTTRTQTNPNV